MDAGRACSAYQDEALRSLTLGRIEVDETWSYCYAKQANIPDHLKGAEGVGDVWTWVALDSATKLVPSWLVGSRTLEDSRLFMDDLKARLAGLVEVRTDKWAGYPETVDWAFEPRASFAQRGDLKATGSGKETTSLVERQNLTMQMGMRRMMRATNDFSRKIENLAAAVSLHFMAYNYTRPHRTLSTGRYPRTPAMAAGVTDHPWTMREIADLLEPN